MQLVYKITLSEGRSAIIPENGWIEVEFSSHVLVLLQNSPK